MAFDRTPPKTSAAKLRPVLTAAVFAIGLAIGVVFYLGWFGMTRVRVVASVGCRETYVDYPIRPFLHDFWQCRRQIPCGTHPELNRQNAHARVLQCLCADPIGNRSAITSVYRQKYRPGYSYSLKRANNTGDICAQETREMFLL